MKMRLIETMARGPHAAKVYFDRAWEEFRVRFYEDGHLRPEADYHTDDRGDALSTARVMLETMGVAS